MKIYLLILFSFLSSFGRTQTRQESIKFNPDLHDTIVQVIDNPHQRLLPVLRNLLLFTSNRNIIYRIEHLKYKVNVGALKNGTITLVEIQNTPSKTYHYKANGELSVAGFNFSATGKLEVRVSPIYEKNYVGKRNAQKMKMELTYWIKIIEPEGKSAVSDSSKGALKNKLRWLGRGLKSIGRKATNGGARQFLKSSPGRKKFQKEIEKILETLQKICLTQAGSG